MPELLLGLVGVPRVDQGNDDGEEPRRGTKQQGLGPGMREARLVGRILLSTNEAYLL